MNKSIVLAAPISVDMFGAFSVSNKNHSLLATGKSGLSSFLLLGYLLSNQGNDITSEMLIDVLWPDGESNNPAGALRTLMHRTKKLLEPFYPGENIEFISKNNNTYSWNRDVFLNIDIYNFEKSVHQAFREDDPEEQYELLEKAFKLYKGEFLNIFSHHSWVMFRNNYYGNLYVKCVNTMCYLLNKEERFEEVLNLCDQALKLSPATDETLHKQKIFTLLNIGKTQVALDYYYSILAMFNTAHGLDITESMTDVYEAILNHLPNKFQTLNTLDKSLRDKDVKSGSFYCNFDIFQNIYQVNLRSARRAKSRFYLVLLTLEDESQDSLITETLKDEMEILHQVMKKKLRNNDVYTKSSICQYSLIINAPSESGVEIVKNRILAGYEKKKKHSSVFLDTEYKEII
ncbi:AfsR/SARP family transcriptional regulator [Ohessyouella blattaphilus]|uniref:Bacterial transcriptional activator domain-containing protein n=1 Tax=Ohessyouella blattaphilus TaxID=2949333 RepID=A0ABT1EJ72_9FIRM|nr:BTAD domain-containing putative transcriptional regulator [Ohessyouella blattaphilus]MCP1109352.1 hypothetical protein [Ohessyouella blattaphilus]MCR8562746.1 hypothetical protein [Ohessyouella blattaphilus]